MNRDADPDSPPGTEEYPLSTGEYPPDPDPPDPDPPDREEPPFWVRLGFDSLEQYLDSLDETWDRLMGGRRVATPDGVHPTPDVVIEPTSSEIGRQLPEPGPRRVRQVNIKVTDEGYSALTRVARSHGLPPATLARVLVARGVRSLLVRDRRRPDG
jgi:hypothetical protein